METDPRLLEWCAAKQLTSTPYYYQEYYAAQKEKHPGVPESVWQYFDYNEFLLDLWRMKKIHILYVDDEGIVPLEDAGDVYPGWKDMETEWFSNHPFKHLYYIVHRETTNES